ncbi:hypothetical protein GCM10009692_16980 [Leucobacter aridicollis]
MRTETPGVAPVSARGVLFLVAFVAFLALSILGPHIHGSDSAPAVPTGGWSAATAPESQVDGDRQVAVAAEGSPAAVPADDGGQALGFGAVCVLVLIASIALLAVRGALSWASQRRGAPLSLAPPGDIPRGSSVPRGLLLSISRT